MQNQVNRIVRNSYNVCGCYMQYRVLFSKLLDFFSSNLITTLLMALVLNSELLCGLGSGYIFLLIILLTLLGYVAHHNRTS